MNKPDNLKDILERVSKSDTIAFGYFFERYAQKVYQFSGYYIRSEPTREEIVSDVFINIWNYRYKLPEITSIENYLFIITRNIAVNYLDKLNRQPENITGTLNELQIETSNPEKILLYKEIEQLLHKAIQELPERCRIIFLMSRDDKLKYHQIAELLSISEKTVHAQMVTALKRLNEALRKYLYYIFL